MQTGVGDTRPSHTKWRASVFNRVFDAFVGSSSVTP
jgi:hypothetical protein